MKRTRRNFLAMTAAALAVPMFIPRTVFAQGNRPGANERLGIGAVGVGRFGSGLLERILRDERTVGVSVCDVFRSRAEDVARRCNITHVVQDYRQVIEHPSVDAVMTATPDHWRPLINITAALAGKHLYAEKPVSLTIEDGKLLRKAVQKTGITFQSGSQMRSNVQHYLGGKFIQEGKLGNITEVIAANYESPWLHDLPAESMPDGLDWDMWCGPTEPVSFNNNIFLPRGEPGWLSLRPYSGGEMSDWGTHGMDLIQFALGMDNTGPVEIFVEGEKLVPPVYREPESRDRGNALCSQPRLTCRYANGVTIRLDPSGHRGGGIFIGERGRVEIVNDRFTSDPEGLAREYLEEHADLRRPSHIADWLNCIYDSSQIPHGNLESGLRIAGLCHILNIARYVGRNLEWDPVKEEFVNDAEANTWLKREHRQGFEFPVIM